MSTEPSEPTSEAAFFTTIPRLLSEELDELFEVSDRLAVIAKGRLSPVKPIRETNVEEIGVWMSGMWPGAKGSGEGATLPVGERHAAQA